MASNRNSGYDLHWVEDPPDDLKCLICLCVARDPQQHPGDDDNNCGKVFCRECITEYQRSKTTCPYCRQNLTLFKDSRSINAVKALKVKCDNETNGCDWTGELSYLETHLQSCDYALVPCTNQCTTDEGINKFLRTYLNNHLNNDCPRRQYECPHCQETGEYQERTTTHLDNCPRVQVNCLNEGCPDMITRCNLETHRSICTYEPVSCKYAAIGCKEKPLRKNLNKHEENDQLHLRVTTMEVLKLTKTVNCLEVDVMQTKERVKHLEQLAAKQEEQVKNKPVIIIAPGTFKIENYDQQKANKSTFYSPPFYTHNLGYKMCLAVNTDTYSIAAGDNVSVYAHLMKGDHDDTLTWPFTGSVTIELLNQLEDKNHLQATNVFSGDKKVVHREKGEGKLQFCISQAVLGKKGSTQYLKDDTLVFRVSVKVSTHMPWLECNM